VQLAECVGCRPSEIVWLSGATEANNLAIKGVASQWRRTHGKAGHVISQQTEHKAILDPLASLAAEGWDITLLPVSHAGVVSPADVAAAIRPDTALVTIMWVNNELGVVMPIREIGALCDTHAIPFHSDASQAVGKLPVELVDTKIDLLSVSAHKFYGPKGVGALVIRRNRKQCKPVASQDGGGHERGYRSGTLNVPAIVGLGMAAELIKREMELENEGIGAIRDRFERTLQSSLADIAVNGAQAERVPHVSNVAIAGVDSECLLMRLPGIAASTGSACTSWTFEPSHVLAAIGLPEAEQSASLRFSFGRFSTEADADEVVNALVQTVPTLRAVSRKQ
jgi:cysteine desulfurase